MAFKQINTNDQNLQLIQSNIDDALKGDNTNFVEKTSQNGKTIFLRSMVSPPFIDGNLIKQSLTAAQDNLVAHGLGRLPIVWLVARLDTNTNVWEVSTTKLATTTVTTRSASNEFLNLWCGSNCNVVIWVN